ncbi:TPA: cation channel, sperm associated 1 [Bos taurus]|nr:TPA: cation channel, sperm associated 1 [Bos taurus]
MGRVPSIVSDQSSMSAKAQNEADTDNSDVLSHPSSSTPYHRPGHGGVHHHHQGASRHHGESHHHGLSHHRGGPHHPDEFQDFHSNVFSHHAHRSYHSPNHESTSTGSTSMAHILMITPTEISTMGTVFQPSKPDRKSSAFSLARSLSTVNSHPSETSNKVYPQDSSSKTSESCPEEDEHVQKRKVGRALRTHKKVHSSDFLYWLWEKLSQLIWGLRRMLRKLVDSLAFETFIIFIVCLNTIMLVAQTFAEVEVRGEWYFTALDYIFLSIYMVEAVLKIIALGLAYFLDPWNNLDFFIMVVGTLDFVLIQVNSSSTRAIHNQSVFRIFRVFKTLRALRAIRVLRRLRFLTNLQEVTGTLARSLPSITAILILMFTCLFLFSVVLRALFRYSDPKRFQNIFTTIFTLFTMLTLDDWSLIYLDSRAQGAWYIIPILMIYIIIQYFIFLNLVIAVLVDNFQMALLKGLEKEKQEKAAELHEKLLDDSVTKLMEAEPKEVLSEHTIQKQLIEKKFGAMTENCPPPSTSQVLSP